LNKRKLLNGIVLIFFFLLPLNASAQPETYLHPEYQKIKKKLISGWNTWNSRSVLSYVLLPECFSINLAFKQHYWLEELYLKEVLIGGHGNFNAFIRPGPHTFSGTYSQLEIKWEHLHARIETALEKNDLVILITPLSKFEFPVKLVIEGGILWNKTGAVLKKGNSLRAELPSRSVDVFSTAELTDDPYVITQTPYLSIFLEDTLGISTNKRRTIEEIRRIVEIQKLQMQDDASRYDKLSDAWIAIQSGISWNTIYEPKLDRVVSTVGRLWNLEYGGYCLFGWDNFFLAYMTALFNRDMAFANIIEHLRGKTEEGFIPNDNRGNGSKSWDRSQPPVGAIMVKEIYKRYPERWFLEATFDDLLNWNKWWFLKRNNNGLLSYGSHLAKNPFKEPNVHNKKAAGYESGMDDSPMYEGVPFNKDKNILEIQDVGLTSLVIADCKALAQMARILNRRDDEKDLLKRANYLEKSLEKLWDDESGFYLNFRTDLNGPSIRLSPTLFYPLLAEVPDQNRAEQMIEEHFYNRREFWGEYVLPSIARNDPAFQKQKYWKGAIWPPLNFLTYLGLRNYVFQKPHRDLAERSLKLFMDEWNRKGYVSENYSAISGTGDDEKISSDRFHSWGALMGFMEFIEQGYMPATELKIK
jgi:glycogen debranching enzyme